MAETIKKVPYFYTEVADKPESGSTREGDSDRGSQGSKH